MATGELDLLKIIWESGYVVKGVLLMLIAASIASWAIVFFKRKSLLVLEESNQMFWDVYLNAEDLDEVFERSECLPFSPYKAVFDMGYRELVKVRETMGGRDKRIKMREHFKEFGLGVIERAMKRGINRSNEEMEKSLSILASIGSVSPFVGLFGTVWGIIDSFTALSGGGGTLEAVAPGIAEALVATAVGLAAAIPAVWFFNYFNDLIGSMNLKLDSFEQEFLNTIERSVA